MVATWFNDYIPALAQTAHTGTSSKTGWNLLGADLTMNGFHLKVKGICGSGTHMKEEVGLLKLFYTVDNELLNVGTVTRSS